MSRSHWAPGSLIPGIALTAQVVLLVLAMIRGIDYGTGDSAETARRLGVVEQAAPMWVWGVLFTAAASCVFVSMAWQWASGVIIGHTALTGLYGAVGVGVGIDVWENAGQHQPGMPSSALLIPVATAALVICGSYKRSGKSMHTVVVGVCVALVLGTFTIDLDGLRNVTILMGMATMHALITINTAQLVAQSSIRRERGESWTGQLIS